MAEKDFINVDPNTGGGNDFNLVFSGKLREMEKVFTEQRKPYCRPCAKTDFDIKVETIKIKMMRDGNINLNVSGKEKEFNLEFDFDNYGKEGYFKVKGERKIYDKRLIAGTNLQVPVHYVDWECPRGHCWSIEMEEDVYNKWKGIGTAKPTKK